MSTPFAHVIGDPIEQSKSPLIHNFWLKQLGKAGDYERCHVTADGLAEYLETQRENPDWRGCNVTMPHKRAILPLLDDIDPVAAAIGAVNTVIRLENGNLVGFNTDAGGFIEPLLPTLRSSHLFRMARILGTGGAARAIVAALIDNGFVLVLAGRDPDKARALLEDLCPESDHHVVHLSYFAYPTNFAFDDREGCLDLVINASPLGMTGKPELSFDWSHAPPGSIAYDIVTDPVDTHFLKSAREAGHTTIDGLAMLLGQAALAFEKFFGGPPPRDEDAKLMKMLAG